MSCQLIKICESAPSCYVRDETLAKTCCINNNVIHITLLLLGLLLGDTLPLAALWQSMLDILDRTTSGSALLSVFNILIITNFAQRDFFIRLIHSITLWALTRWLQDTLYIQHTYRVFKKWMEIAWITLISVVL